MFTLLIVFVAKQVDYTSASIAERRVKLSQVTASASSLFESNLSGERKS